MTVTATSKLARSAVLLAAAALLAVACVEDRQVSLATDPDGGGSGGPRDGGSGDGGPRGGDGGTAGSAGTDGASGSSGSSAACEPGVFDEGRFDEACFQ